MLGIGEESPRDKDRYDVLTLLHTAETRFEGGEQRYSPSQVGDTVSQNGVMDRLVGVVEDTDFHMYSGPLPSGDYLGRVLED